MTDISSKTRKIFDNIHRAHLGHEYTKKRLRTLINLKDMGLPPDYFVGKKCADIGCGSSVHGSVNLLELGAAYVSACDYDDSFIEPALSQLIKFSGQFSLDVGSVTNMPYEDNSFDFVLCNGVLHHVVDDVAALNDLARILKPGGNLLLLVAGSGGLLGRFVMEVCRSEYRENREFKDMIDASNAEFQVKGLINWLAENINDVNDDASKNSLVFLKALELLIDEDFILTIRDRLYAPIYRTYNLRDLESLCINAGFSDVTRISRRPHFSNIRKILESVYENYDHKYSKVMYGSGSMLLLIRK